VIRKFIYLFFTAVLLGCSNGDKGELILVEPDSTSSFHYPYFLYLPKNGSNERSVHVVIEPNNSGFADDDFQKHIMKAERTATREFYLGNYVAQQLKIPLLVPVFPRPKTDWMIYTHALDRDVMAQKNNPLERIDLQLIEMFNDARMRLKAMNINTKDKFLMTGFSASGTFVNRFTLIHPDRVSAVAAGGVNGLLMLPVDVLEGKPLPYPLGTYDLGEFLNIEFQKELFIQTPQFYFMGDLDDNDAVPFSDAFSEDEREKIFSVLGKEMQTERWPACTTIYQINQVNAQILTVENTGHEQTESIKKEVVRFFLQYLAE
jgi:hypothetical protein